MCGIAAIYSRSKAYSGATIIQKMNATLKHRGPDAAGYQVRGQTTLGHTRLSIVDLAAGPQPLVSPDQRWAISYNGEIYNYKSLRLDLMKQGVHFHTHTDTEVVLQLFMRQGIQCVHSLRGMFSFIVHDQLKDSLYVVRDRCGIKPVYYYNDDQHFVAASEIKAIFASGWVQPRLNLDSLWNYFVYQFAVSPYTAFQDIYEVPPGHYLTMEAGEKPQLVQYWDVEFPEHEQYESMDEAYWTPLFLEAMHDAVDSHKIGDVPIGAYLSGGIDSAAITWLLTQHYQAPLQTFSIHFSNPDFDESSVYRRVAEHIHVANSELIFDDHRPEGYLNALKQCIYHLEQPQRLAVDIPHFELSHRVQEQGYKVVYTGDGSDEIFGGYDCYRQDQIRTWGNELNDEKKREQVYLSQYRELFSDEQMRMLLMLHTPEKQTQTIARYGCYPAWHDFWSITADLLPNLFSPESLQHIDAQRQTTSLFDTIKKKIHNRHMLNQSLYMELKTRLPGWILWKSDRLSMAHGVEARVPFLDHALVELTARMPPHLKLQGMDEKYLLRKTMTPHLPPSENTYKKRAFYTPIREWFFTPEKAPQLAPYLSPEAINKTGIFNPLTVDRYYHELLHADTPKNLSQYYYTMKREWILMLVLSIQIMHEQFIAPYTRSH